LNLLTPQQKLYQDKSLLALPLIGFADNLIVLEMINHHQQSFFEIQLLLLLESFFEK